MNIAKVALLILIVCVTFIIGVFCQPVIKYWRSKILFSVYPERVVHPDYNFNARRVSHFNDLGTNRPIVLLGDSRIDDVEWGEILGRSDVSNRGIAGDTVNGVGTRLAASIPSIAKVCVVQVGFNDILHGAPSEHVFSCYSGLLQDLAQCSEQIVLLPVIPAGSRYNHVNSAILSLNLMLETYAETQNTIWLDLNKIYAPDGILIAEYTDDDIHLNGRATRIMASSLGKLFEELVP